MRYYYSVGTCVGLSSDVEVLAQKVGKQGVKLPKSLVKVVSHSFLVGYISKVTLGETEPGTRGLVDVEDVVGQRPGC